MSHYQPRQFDCAMYRDYGWRNANSYLHFAIRRTATHRQLEVFVAMQKTGETDGSQDRSALPMCWIHLSTLAHRPLVAYSVSERTHAAR